MALNLYSSTTTDTLLAAKLDLAGGTMTGALNLSASGIIFSDSTYLTTAPAGSTLAADQLTAGAVTANPTAGPTAAGDVLKYDGSALIWAPGGGSVAWGSITGTVTDQTDLTTYLAGAYYPLSGNPSGFLTSVPGKTVNDISAVVPYTLQLSDANNIVYCSGGTFQMIVVPNDGTVNFPIGTEITIVTNDIYNWVTGGTFGPYPTINGSSGNVAVGGYVTKLVKVAAETWFLG